MTHSILFVCLGNICRSPSAEGVLRAMARDRGVPLVIDSAGTGDWHIGEPPYDPMQQAARARGYDLSSLRARQVTPEDFYRFDLLIAMDDANLDHLRRIRPADGTADVRLFTEYVPRTGATHVPDPYYTRDFDGTLDLVETAARGLLDQLE
ncbi:phosphotyrosine protein phosphatase [Salipiger aestuarii]|uniref:protein-tyrosine-phosphatase n=1 Tax=Salipiger aestuarii TaxID=568098 RepID=A0A327Y3H9_9RHOB|nr:low molecular weight protein-tyrosine-phosphatase [Salipiger aestuarii]EIE51997.1 low molecular weight phosphotyrosine protein phosphatase [Citreicella sp. 357]KAA8606350.1 phosphotyrosine protein phosphatase [Salipiger aestuarii]KAA8610638.1 phosphotyrosine protein phosphatase [Salipiger aestuarii]KAB2541632.1 phosphotyrosine protein phosphatase [Salipiger aestuarii]RAK14892.1 protein-tyrosine phosphatase [Salipiger aestuarii]